jgi:phenylacetate-CoA ligase
MAAVNARRDDTGQPPAPHQPTGEGLTGAEAADCLPVSQAELVHNHSMEEDVARQSQTRADLDREKLRRLNALLAEILPANRFYAEKLKDCTLPISSLEQLRDWPLTTKEELVRVADETGQPANLTFSLDRYQRFHQTSGTRGLPMPVFDTAEDWTWWMECWQAVLHRGDVGPGDRVLVASSFGPYVGFWSGFEGVLASGAMAIPCGGMSTMARLDLARRTTATVLMATPSYCLHLAESAEAKGFDLEGLAIRLVVVAGEPGGSVPSVRHRIAEAFAAEVLDHAGATEVGPWGVGDRSGQWLEVLEPWFHPEFLVPGGVAPAAPDEPAELVITTLGRAGAPVVRYRTGDVVRAHWPDDRPGGTPPRVRLLGGVLGRHDDMLVIRGVNIFPRAIDEIVRSFPEIMEYRLSVHREAALDGLSLEIEDRLEQPARVADELRIRLGLRIEVSCVPADSLPRFEGKGHRVIDLRPRPAATA